MDDQEALIARRVAMTAAAWFNAPADVEAYLGSRPRSGRNAYSAPQLEIVDVDDLADVAPSLPVGEGVADFGAVLPRQSRRQLQRRAPRPGSEAGGTSRRRRPVAKWPVPWPGSAGAPARVSRM